MKLRYEIDLSKRQDNESLDGFVLRALTFFKPQACLDALTRLPLGRGVTEIIIDSQKVGEIKITEGKG